MEHVWKVGDLAQCIKTSTRPHPVTGDIINKGYVGTVKAVGMLKKGPILQVDNYPWSWAKVWTPIKTADPQFIEQMRNLKIKENV